MTKKIINWLSVKNEHGISNKDKVVILTYSTLNVFSFIFAIFFIFAYLFTNLQRLLFQAGVYLVVSVGSGIFLRYYTNNHERHETNRTDIINTSV